MINFDILSQELRQDEGVRPYAYQDSEGYWTIGVGRLIDQRRGGRLSDEEINLLLNNDLQKCLLDIQNEPWYLSLNNDIQRQGILNMRFQLGSAGIRTFKTSLGLIAQGKFKEAGANLRLSNWFKETPERAERVILQIENG
jgi:lysozyme